MAHVILGSVLVATCVFTAYADSFKTYKGVKTKMANLLFVPCLWKLLFLLDVLAPFTRILCAIFKVDYDTNLDWN